MYTYIHTLPSCYIKEFNRHHHGLEDRFIGGEKEAENFAAGFDTIRLVCMHAKRAKVRQYKHDITYTYVNIYTHIQSSPLSKSGSHGNTHAYIKMVNLLHIHI